jgi:hypothetical protein
LIVVPLFETIRATPLPSCAALCRTWRACWFGAAARAGHIMLGYSDSKQQGRRHIHQQLGAVSGLRSVLRSCSNEPGATADSTDTAQDVPRRRHRAAVARSYQGDPGTATTGQPCAGKSRLTEQGEVIGSKYANPGITGAN